MKSNLRVINEENSFLPFSKSNQHTFLFIGGFITQPIYENIHSQLSLFSSKHLRTFFKSKRLKINKHNFTGL